MSPPGTPIACPCGTGAPYGDCCGPFHRGRVTGLVTAPTAERLMRSRYSAFALGERDYLVQTWHPSTRPATLELDGDLEWRRLEILGTTAGGERDLAGTVAFVAHFWDAANRQAGRQPENSAFAREAGQWFYVGPAPGPPA